MKKWTVMAGVFLIGGFATAIQAAEIVMPQERNVFYANESVEIAVAGLPKGATANLEIAPKTDGANETVKWTVNGDGGTVTGTLAPNSFAPGKYTIKLDGKEVAPLTISSGVIKSSMPLSQTTRDPFKGGGNFSVGNAFSFSLLDKDGRPVKDVRGKKSPSMAKMEKMVESDYPAICYMYWTGFVTHKPFGSEKSWGNAKMQEAMRLLNFSVAQRLRRYAPLWLGVGPLDEPGLSWGKTPAGGMASGFPNWDEQPWYETRGWKYTQDIAGGSDADWMKYIAVRCGIMKESYQLAKDDIKTVWPTAKFEGDLYALHAVMDGCDGLNQQVNDTPTSHVFFDWFGGPMSVPGQFNLEKCHAPTTKLAHAMNGQLTGARGPQLPLYHWLMNGMLQGGLASNWWLNTKGMTDDDLKAVNEPVANYGPLFKEMSSAGHDVAILWGFTELSMRQKEMAKLESTKKSGEQIKLMVPMPDASEMTESELQSHAYEVGGTYSNQILRLHQTLRRAGYAPHILHEKLLPGGILKNYKVLCIVDQKAELPADVKSAIAEFVKAGGALLVDKSCKAKFEGATTMEVNLGAEAMRQLNIKNTQMAKAANNKREASTFASNLLFDSQWSSAVAAVKTAMAKTAAKAIVKTDSLNLSVERHVGGEGELLMVLNGFEKYPDGIAEDNEFPRYNPASATHSYTLQNIPKGANVWCIEELDWKKITKLADPSAQITANFAAGEMKLYLVTPSTPKGIVLKSKAEAGKLAVDISLDGLKMPWPITVKISAPDGKVIYTVQRSTDKTGRYSEQFPVGTNAKTGEYAVMVESPVGDLKFESKTMLSSKPSSPTLLTASARVIDKDTIGKFLAGKPELTIAFANDTQKAAADKLAPAFNAKGIKATVKPEAGLLAKVAYPRVLNPFIKVFAVGGEEKKPSSDVKENITLDVNFAGDWKKPNTLITVGNGGFLDWQNKDIETVYEAGVKIYFDEKKKMTVLNAAATDVKADAAFRAKWCKPWTKLISYNGGYQLPAQLPEAYTTDSHLIVLGDGDSSEIAAILQASEILPQVADAKYPGPGKALVQFAWSPFAVGKNVIFIGANDAEGLKAGADTLMEMVK